MAIDCSTSTPLSILLIIFGLMCCVFIFIAIHGLYGFIAKEKELMQTMSARLKCFEITFLISTILAIVFNVPLALSQCFFSDLKIIFVMPWLIFYGIQTYLLGILFFYRLVRVFQRTRLRVTKATQTIYKTSFIVLPTYFFLVAIFFVAIVMPLRLDVSHPWLPSILFGLAISSFVLLSASLMALFVIKLTQSYRGMSDQALISAITKLTVLNTISITITLVDGFVTVFFFGLSDSKYFHWIDIASDYFSVLDTFTNFCCILLSYQSFKMYYWKVCLCCDSGCNVCISKMVNRTAQKETAKGIALAIGAKRVSKTETDTNNLSTEIVEPPEKDPDTQV
eukprot:187440_1